MLEVTVKKIKFGGSWIVNFETGGEIENPEALPEVSLSRKHGACMFRVDQLSNHDSHSPGFVTEEDTDAYILRVVTEIKEKVGEAITLKEKELEGIPIPVPVSGVSPISFN